MSEKFEFVVSSKKEISRRCSLGQRHVVALFGFLCNFFQSAIRIVLSVNVVAMVKHREENSSPHINNTEMSCPLPISTPKHQGESNFQGEFDWSTEIQGYLLGIGFLSFLFTQIPGGRLADAIGSKSILVISNAISGILTLSSPFAARWHVYALMTVHFLKGLSQGFSLPAKFKLISNWIPKNERGTLSTLAVCGFGAGIAVGSLVTGWLCDIPGFGWPSAFYFWGLANVALAVAIQFFCYEYPEDHPGITKEEIKYITEGLEINLSKKHPPTPWKKIFSSVPCYAYFYGLFGHYWAIAYFATVHPTFMGVILHHSMTENGLTSGLPVLMKIAGGVAASIMCHFITKKNLISINKQRKITTCFGAVGFSLCMGGLFLAECDVIINILCFALSLFVSGVALSGIMIAGVDMAPVFSGSLMGVASTIAGLSCVLLPVITGFVTIHETLAGWQIVFFINLVIVGSSGLVYAIFGSADVQSWNFPKSEQSVNIVITEEIILPDKNIQDSTIE